MQFTNHPISYTPPQVNHLQTIYTQNGGSFNASMMSRIYNAKPGCSSCGKH